MAAWENFKHEIKTQLEFKDEFGKKIHEFINKLICGVVCKDVEDFDYAKQLCVGLLQIFKFLIGRQHPRIKDLGDIDNLEFAVIKIPGESVLGQIIFFDTWLVAEDFVPKFYERLSYWMSAKEMETMEPSWTSYSYYSHGLQVEVDDSFFSTPVLWSSKIFKKIPGGMYFSGDNWVCLADNHMATAGFKDGDDKLFIKFCPEKKICFKHLAWEKRIYELDFTLFTHLSRLYLDRYRLDVNSLATESIQNLKEMKLLSLENTSNLKLTFTQLEKLWLGHGFCRLTNTNQKDPNPYLLLEFPKLSWLCITGNMKRKNRDSRMRIMLEAKFIANLPLKKLTLTNESFSDQSPFSPNLASARYWLNLTDLVVYSHPQLKSFRHFFKMSETAKVTVSDGFPVPESTF